MALRPVRRFACVSVATLVLLSPSAASAVPTLTKSQAQYYTKKTLQRSFKDQFYAGGYRRLCKRASRIRFRCDVGWFIGDLSFGGRVVIWVSENDDGEAYWNYAYGITRLDEYCALVEKRPFESCVKRYRVR